MKPIEIMNYLFIDDNRVQLMVLKKALEQFCSAHEIKTLDNPMAAIDLIRSQVFVPDVVVVDFNMREMDGLDFIKRMKFSDDWYSYIPIVVWTTVDCAETAKACYGSGAAGYMIKPTYYKELIGMLRVLIQYWEANLNPFTSIDKIVNQ